MQLSPVLAELAQYPFARLDDWKAEATATRDRADRLRGGRSPRGDAGVHPRGAGRRASTSVRRIRARRACPSCAARSAEWIDRRFGVAVDPDREIVPTLGSKEAIFSFAQLVIGESGVRRHSPSPPTPSTSAARSLPAAPSCRSRCARRTAGCPTSTRSTPGTSSRSSGFATRTTRRARRRRSRSTRSSPGGRVEHGFLLCSDEAYSELWFDEPPVSALQVADRENVVVFNTLSKRSSMTGYRSGVRVRPAGDRRRTARGSGRRSGRRRRNSSSARRWRPGRTTPTSTMCALSTGASANAAACPRGGWVATRGLDRDVLPLARRRRPVGGVRAAAARARRRLRTGIVLRAGRRRHVRFTLVPTQEECERAAEIVRTVLASL